MKVQTKITFCYKGKTYNSGDIFTIEQKDVKTFKELYEIWAENNLIVILEDNKSK